MEGGVSVTKVPRAITKVQSVPPMEENSYCTQSVFSSSQNRPL